MKKSNLEIVKDYLSGDRPIIQVGYEGKDEHHDVGSMWTDLNGITWQQRHGYRIRVNPQANLIRELTKRICKTCKKEINMFASMLDQKLYTRTGNCADCQIKEETLMRINGTYENYEKKKVFMNQLSYMEDIADKIRDQYKQIPTDTVEFRNIVDDKNAQVVQEEKWSAIDKNALRKSLKTDYRMVFAEILKIKKEIKKLE